MRLVAFLLASLLVVSGCAPVPRLPVDASPEVVARRYFELLAAGRDSEARALVWRPERFDRTVKDRSLKGLTELDVSASREDSAAHRPSEYRQLAEIRLLRVTYTRHRASSVGEPPGRDGRFVLLGRETSAGPWLIVEIGTGP